MRSKLPAIEGRRLTTELTVHNNDFGGVTAVVYGSKGSGKTTLFLTLCQTVQCYNKNGQLELETSIWRGGDEDYWTWLPKDRTRVFIHRDNFDTVTFKKDEDLTEYDRKDLPPIIMYKNNVDLYSKLLRGGINVVYEPTTYDLTDRLKKMIQKRGVAGDDLFKKKEVDQIIWWFEFIDWLRVNKSIEHISVFIDEADQLLPVSPSGARWHLNLWFKDIMRALRKRNISLFMACHGYMDIDGRIRPKVMYRLYMKGSCAPSESLVFKTAPVTLPQGKYYIERDAWGWARFNKINEQPRVLVVLKKDEADDYVRDIPDGGVPPTDPINSKNTQPVIKEDKIKSEVTDIVVPIGIDALPIDKNIIPNRKPGEFIPLIPKKDESINGLSIGNIETNKNTPAEEISYVIQNMDDVKKDNKQSITKRKQKNETDETYVSPSLEDLLDSPDDLKSDKYDPTKDDLFE